MEGLTNNDVVVVNSKKSIFGFLKRLPRFPKKLVKIFLALFLVSGLIFGGYYLYASSKPLYVIGDTKITKEDIQNYANAIDEAKANTKELDFGGDAKKVATEDLILNAAYKNEMKTDRKAQSDKSFDLKLKLIKDQKRDGSANLQKLKLIRAENMALKEYLNDKIISLKDLTFVNIPYDVPLYENKSADKVKSLHNESINTLKTKFLPSIKSGVSQQKIGELADINLVDEDLTKEQQFDQYDKRLITFVNSIDGYTRENSRINDMPNTEYYGVKIPNLLNTKDVIDTLEKPGQDSGVFASQNGNFMIIRLETVRGGKFSSWNSFYNQYRKKSATSKIFAYDINLTNLVNNSANATVKAITNIGLERAQAASCSSTHKVTFNIVNWDDRTNTQLGNITGITQTHNTGGACGGTRSFGGIFGGPSLVDNCNQNGPTWQAFFAPAAIFGAAWLDTPSSANGSDRSQWPIWGQSTMNGQGDIDIWVHYLGVDRPPAPTISFSDTCTGINVATNGIDVHVYVHGGGILGGVGSSNGHFNLNGVVAPGTDLDVYGIGGGSTYGNTLGRHVWNRPSNCSPTISVTNRCKGVELSTNGARIDVYQGAVGFQNTATLSPDVFILEGRVAPGTTLDYYAVGNNSSNFGNTLQTHQWVRPLDCTEDLTITINNTTVVLVPDDENPSKAEYKPTISAPAGKTIPGVKITCEYSVKKPPVASPVVASLGNSNEASISLSPSHTCDDTGPNAINIPSPPAPLNTGDEVCQNVSAIPNSGLLDNSLAPGVVRVNIASGAIERHGPAALKIECKPVINKPYVSFYGNDVKAGMGIEGVNSCMTNLYPAASITTYTNSASQGSGVQIAAFALGTISGFKTEKKNSSSGSDTLTAQSFGSYGQNCTHDYNSEAPQTVTPWSGTLEEGKRKVAGPISIGNINIAANNHHYLYVDGDVTITNNITLTSTITGTDLKSIPSFYLVAKGNIYIQKDVTKLDGVYVAQDSHDSTKGHIYTCANGSSPYLRNSGNTDLYTKCNKQLVVDGVFIGQRMHFDRTFGSLRDSSSDSPFSGAPRLCSNGGSTTSVCAGEVFNFNPSLILANAPKPNSNSTNTNDLFPFSNSLPPIL